MAPKTKSQLLRRALLLLDGLTFESTLTVSKDYGDVLLPLVITKQVVTKFDDIILEQVASSILEPVRQVFLYCVKYEDVYRRLRGDMAFYYLILADWNSAHEASPLPAASLEKLISLFVGARRRFEAGSVAAEDEGSGEEEEEDEEDEEKEADDAGPPGVAARPSGPNVRLTMFIDRWIAIIDDVNASRASRRPPSLKAPAGVDAASTLGARTWPPAHFNAVDVAIMAQTAVREKVYGIDHMHKVEEDQMPTYPHDQTTPLDVRKFLAWMSLEETAPRSPTSLFLAPVAFMGDEDRQKWYLPTGHKSRLYATVDEFISYAKVAFKSTAADAIGSKKHVIGLLTPWFFETEWLTAKAQEQDQAIPTVWQGQCFRAGTVVCLTRLMRVGDRHTCRLLLFTPDKPHYFRPSQPSDRINQQEAWLKTLAGKLKDNFQIEEGWFGGRAQNHYGPSLAERPVTADSVESSSEIIQEIMMDVAKLPTDETQLRERDFWSMAI
ncbi:hypothetical protein F4821DRAFT_276836 [Hypoxylon rubiginosum]|uniref:Uncharacterized protein n=1 Tax=Hypoxylon rubiginosum TaxID=110542 RepID=A0ACC0DLL5_9PEZI|nr:hypothetical protein F4821DRAFT_276836 [Hypoxylon rubiginosum]